MFKKASIMFFDENTRKTHSFQNFLDLHRHESDGQYFIVVHGERQGLLEEILEFKPGKYRVRTTTGVYTVL